MFILSVSLVNIEVLSCYIETIQKIKDTIYSHVAQANNYKNININQRCY